MKTIDLTITVDGPAEAAQSTIHDRVDQPLHSAGFNGHEQVTFTFEEQGRSTAVRASGRLPDRAYAEVTEAFGAG